MKVVTKERKNEDPIEIVTDVNIRFDRPLPFIVPILLPKTGEDQSDNQPKIYPDIQKKVEYVSEKGNCLKKKGLGR